MTNKDGLKLYIGTGPSGSIGLKFDDGTPLPNQLSSGVVHEDGGVLVLSIDFVIDGESVFLGDPK